MGISIDPIFLEGSPAVSGFYYSPKGKKKKKMAKGTYKLVVKDGDTKYNYDGGNYKAKTVDYVQEADNLADALYNFLEWVSDSSNDLQVKLVFSPKGKK